MTVRRISSLCFRLPQARIHSLRRSITFLCESRRRESSIMFFAIFAQTSVCHNEPLLSRIVRSIFYAGHEKNMLVTGYGVELAVKQSEYKAVDDTKVLGKIRCHPAHLKNFTLGIHFFFFFLLQRRSRFSNSSSNLRTTSTPDFDFQSWVFSVLPQYLFINL